MFKIAPKEVLSDSIDAVKESHVAKAAVVVKDCALFIPGVTYFFGREIVAYNKEKLEDAKDEVKNRFKKNRKDTETV